MPSLSIAKITIVAALLLNVTVVGAGMYMFKVMSRPEPQVVAEQRYTTDVIKNELLHVGGVFDRVANLARKDDVTAGSTEVPVAPTPTPTPNPGDFGRHDLTVTE